MQTDPVPGVGKKQKTVEWHVTFSKACVCSDPGVFIKDLVDWPDQVHAVLDEDAVALREKGFQFLRKANSEPFFRNSYLCPGSTLCELMNWYIF